MKNTITFLLAVIFSILIILPAQAGEEYDLLIITPEFFFDELQPLKEWKNETGRSTIIATLDEVEDRGYTGARDMPEKIKMFIADYVIDYKVKYVLLAGDSDQFPVRYIKAYNTQWGDKYYPSDLYYMDLFDAQGNFDDWDGDGDDILGEMDFKGGTNINKVNLDDIDMYPDVAVARVPASTEEEMNNYVTKVLHYEQTADASWFNNALLVLDGGPGGWGNATKMNATASAYMKGFAVNKIYQDDTPFNTMSVAQRGLELEQAINAGVGVVNYYGHGNRLQFDGLFFKNNISSLNNQDYLPIVFASACYTGRFHFDLNHYIDVTGKQFTGQWWTKQKFPEPMPIQPESVDAYLDESFAEHFLVKSTSGAIAYIGATSKTEHGVWLENTKGLSPYFFKELDYGVRTLGDIWRNALNEFITDLYHPTKGGNYYYMFSHIHKMILFGDPSLVVGGMDL